MGVIEFYVQSHEEKFTVSDTYFSVELSKAVYSSSYDIVSYKNNQTCSQFCSKTLTKSLW